MTCWKGQELLLLILLYRGRVDPLIERGTTQSREDTPSLRSKALKRFMKNFIHKVENFRLLTLSDTLVNEKKNVCLGVCWQFLPTFNVYSQWGYILPKNYLFLYTEISISLRFNTIK